MKLFKNNDVRAEKKKKLIKKYPTLIEDDFSTEDDDKLLNHLQQKTGKTKSELREIIKNL